MAIHIEKLWTIKCDFCGEYFTVDDFVSYSVFRTSDEAIAAFGNDPEWGYDSVHKGMIICPECRDDRMKRENSNFEIDGLQ